MVAGLTGLVCGYLAGDHQGAFVAENSFGRYRLIGLLGQGGMGQVYRAYDTATDRVVALKVLPPHLVKDPTVQQRFRREAQTAASLSDPHVIPIHSYGEIEGRLYVDMQLIEGRDLGEVLADGGPMDPARAVRIVEQVAEALDAAHAVKLVHRDIKPSNILLARRDFVYLIDFGIARAVGATRYTGTGAAIGTLAYMAPERFDAEEVGPLADVYALACVLHECLTGSQPYPGTSLEKQIAGHLNKPPPRPSTMQAGVPSQLDDVIAKGMAKDPNERFQSAMALADAAHDALDDRAIVASAPTVFEPTVVRPAPPAAVRVRAPGPETTGSAPLRLAGLLILGAALILAVLPLFAVRRSRSLVRVILHAAYEPALTVAMALSFVLAAAAFALIAIHHRTRERHATTAAGAWVVAAAFVVSAALFAVAAINPSLVSGWEFAVVCVFLIVFGVIAATGSHRRYMLWASAAGLAGLVGWVGEEFNFAVSVIDRTSWAMVSLLCVFAAYLYVRGQRQPQDGSAAPGLLAMVYAGLIVIWWVLGPVATYGSWWGSSRDFLLYFEPFSWRGDQPVDPGVGLAATLIFALSFIILGPQLKRGAAVLALMLGSVVLIWAWSGLASSPVAIGVFALLCIFGVVSAFVTRRPWAWFACAAGLLGAPAWILLYFSGVDHTLTQIMFLVWCGLDLRVRAHAVPVRPARHARCVPTGWADHPLGTDDAP